MACRDSSAASAQLQMNGASIREPRSVALTKPHEEGCLVCHGPNRLASISLVHIDRTP